MGLKWISQATMAKPPNPPKVGLDMENEDDHHRQISLLMGQILSPIYTIKGAIDEVHNRKKGY